MTFWLDAQLSPRLARWLTATFGVPASPVRAAADHAIYQAAAVAGATVITKDNDFVISRSSTGHRRRSSGLPVVIPRRLGFMKSSSFTSPSPAVSSKMVTRWWGNHRILIGFET